MRDYIKLNENRWNHVKNNYTEPLIHEELENVRKSPISVALAVGRKVPIEWLERASGKKISDLVCGGGQQGSIFAVKGYDVTIMDLSVSQLRRDGMVAEREDLKANTVQADMTKPFPFEDENFDIISNPVSNVYIKNLENMHQKISCILKKGGPLMVGFMNPWVYMYGTNIVQDEPDEELRLKFSIPFDSKELEEGGKMSINPEYGYEFSHTLETQIKGQPKNGLAMIDFYESCDKRDRLSRYGNNYMATLCTKL